MQTDVLTIISQVLTFLLDHPDLVALALVLLGAARVEGGKFLAALKAKQWDALDNILVEFMTQAATTIMDNPERKTWVLSQTLQAAHQLGLTKSLGIAAPEDLSRRMETLWTTVVQPQLKAEEARPKLQDFVPKMPEAAMPEAKVDVEVKDGKAIIEAGVGPISIKLPLELPF